MNILFAPVKFITNYSFMKSSRVHNLFVDYYDYFLSEDMSTEKKINFLKILSGEVGKCYVEDLRKYLKRKFPEHQLLSYIEQSNDRYTAGAVYDATGICPFDSEGIYHAVLKIFQNYCENEKDLVFIVDHFKTKLGPSHASSFSDFLFERIPSNPLITRLVG